MKNKSFSVFIFIYLFLFVINYLTPMSFGDDYLYSFIWQGHSMFDPLTENAVRISTWNDLIASQWSLYLTWGGRIIGQTLTQIFAWKGKDFFNIFNAFMGTLLIAEIYWCSNRGKISLDFISGMMLWIFFALWAFVPGFSEVFFWLTCSCIYLWPAVFLLGFLLIYIKKFYNYYDKIKVSWVFNLEIFIFGLVAGCGNENSICWIILVLICFLSLYKKTNEPETWMYTGLAGLIIGYAVLMLAPGNLIRLNDAHTLNWLQIEGIKHHSLIFLVVLLFQVFMWHFCLRSTCSLSKVDMENGDIFKDILLVKTCLIISFGMSFIMLLSPEYPIRSGFHGTIPLLIATCILLRMQREYNLTFINKNTKAFIVSISVIYFLVTTSVSVFNFFEKNEYMKDIICNAKQLQETSKTEMLKVRPFRNVSFIENLFSGLHIPNYDLSEDENNWRNVSFARYYGINGVHIVKDRKTDHYE